jgi:translation initiation factor 1A
MPKKKGNSHKHKPTETRPLILKEEEQEYALVTKLLGGCRLQLKCMDEQSRIGVIRRRLKRGKINKIEIDDLVLISIRDFSSKDKFADVIHRYLDDEVKTLKKLGEIQESDVAERTYNPEEEDLNCFNFESI